MARSKYKLNYFSRCIWKHIFVKKKILRRKTSEFRLFSRSSRVPLLLLNTYVSIHKGSIFKRLFVHKLIIGRKFGEFAFTRKPFFFVSKKKKR